MARVGLAMMFHDKPKMIGTLTGVVFAVVLANQQLGTFLGLVDHNTMFVANSGADLWIAPASIETFPGGGFVPDSALHQARATEGVEWAEPLIVGTASLQLPSGGAEPVTLVGTRAPSFRGGPWNVVVGSSDALSHPDTVIFESSERMKLGALNEGSVRELSGHRVVAGGFTWGLIPFGPSYAFAEYDFARVLLERPRDRLNFVLVGVTPGADVPAVKARLQAERPELKVLTRGDFEGSIVRYLLTGTAIGITFGTSTMFGLIIGFVIVSLSMFSAVLDNIREFGTLKALGVTTMDFARLLLVQSVAYAIAGSLVGLAAVAQIAAASRSPNLAMCIPPSLLAGTVVTMVLSAPRPRRSPSADSGGSSPPWCFDELLSRSLAGHEDLRHRAHRVPRSQGGRTSPPSPESS